MNETVNSIPANLTPSRTARRPLRALGASLSPPLVLLAVACGVDTDAPDAHESSVEAALGSDHHLELQAADIASRVTRQREQAAYGSDRHFGTIAELAAAARLRAVQGSDRHLQMLADELAGQTSGP